MIADLRVRAVQTASVLGENDYDYARASRSGALWTGNWKEHLVAAGVVAVTQVGGITAGAAPLLYSGGGAGTTVDTDQPEVILGVPSGYYLVPLRIMVSARVNIDIDAEIAEIIAFADRTQANPSAPTCEAAGGALTFLNALDGAGVPGGITGHSLVSTDITDPVCSELLDSLEIYAVDSSAVGEHTIQFKMDYKPETPSILQGPCSIVVCWGGSDALGVLAVASLKVAVVPSTWFA